MDLIERVSADLTPDLPPAPAGMHWLPAVAKSDEGDVVRVTATWRLVPTLVFDEDD